MIIKKNEGLIAAPFTPMNPDKSINLSRIPALYKNYLEQDIKGVFINGSTGEGLSLTTAERKAIAEAWKDEVSGDFKLFVHIGHTSLMEAKALAKHSADLGVSGISTVGPFYMRPQNVEELVEFCAEMAAEAPQTPFYYYHIPALTGVKFAMLYFLTAASKQIPTLAGIKFSDNDFMEYDRCQGYEEEKYDILFGVDELMVCGRLFGARGFVGSTYNLFPRLYYEIMEAFDAGNFKKARQLQTKSIAFVQAINKYGYSGAAKSLMKFIGVDCGPVRQPLKNPEPAQMQQLESELQAIGFFDYVRAQTTVPE